MPSREALQEHLAVPRDRVCNPREGISSQNPEDGIVDQHESLLNNRKAAGKIDNWQTLWRSLFPSDDIVPEPGECFHVDRFVSRHISLRSILLILAMQISSPQSSARSFTEICKILAHS